MVAESLDTLQKQDETSSLRNDLTDLSALTGIDDEKELSEIGEDLSSHFEELPKVGRFLDVQKGSGRFEFVIPLTEQKQKERVLETLTKLSIFPWEENGLLIIENKNDLRKLILLGAIPSEKDLKTVSEEPTPDDSSPTTTARHNFFPFPMKESELVTTFPPNNKLRKKEAQENMELEGIDAELNQIIDAFDSGKVGWDDPKIQKRIGVLPSLALFPRKYIWENGIVRHARSGDEISEEELSKLLSQAQDGNAKAVEDLVRINIGFVLRRVALAKGRYPNTDADDLFQEGLIGLVKAIEKHDEDIGGNLLTYATHWIDQNMLRFAKRYQKPMVLPENTMKQRGAYFESEKQAEQHPEGKRQIIRKKLIDDGIINKDNDTDVALDRFERKYLVNALFDPIEESLENESSKSDTSKEVESNQLSETITEALSSLPPRYERVIRLRFGLMSPEMLSNIKMHHEIEEDSKRNISDGLTLEEIGIMFGVSRGRIGEMVAHALRMMKHPRRAKVLRYFLDE